MEHEYVNENCKIMTKIMEQMCSENHILVVGIAVDRSMKEIFK